MILLLIACHTQPLDSDTGPLPPIALPCPQGQTLTLPALAPLTLPPLTAGTYGVG